MTTFPFNPKPSFKEINAAVAALSKLDTAKSVLPGEQNPASKTSRLLRLFRGVTPLLRAFAAWPVLPNSWRAALTAFLNAFEEAAEEIGAAFKAGKDL